MRTSVKPRWQAIAYLIPSTPPRSSETALLKRIEALEHEHEQHVQTIAAISFGPSVTVGPGAVVQIDDRFVVVAVPAPEFAYGEVRMIGISTRAPLFRAMKGLRLGDAFQFNHRTYVIRGLW